MKRFLPLLCFFAVFNGEATSQDRLEPADSFYDTQGNEAYRRVIRDYLISSGNGRFTSRFWAIPSFSKEYFMGTEQEGEKFFMICRTPEKHIWEDGVFYRSVQRIRSGYIPEIIEIKRCISENDVRLLNLLIEAAVIGARFDPDFRSGLDGIDYFFSTSGRTATIWSPESGSKTEELIAILEEVIDMAISGDMEFTPGFRAKIEELTELFQYDI